MADRPEVIPLLRDEVEARRKQLKMTPGAFHEAVGFASTTVDNMRKGYRRAYSDDVKWAVCDVLGWTDDSIDRLLRGKAPQMRPAGSTAPKHETPTEPTNAALAAKLDRILELLERPAGKQPRREHGDGTPTEMPRPALKDRGRS